MSRRTKEDALKTRTRILARALMLFAKNGYDKVSFADIAARLKLTKGAIYWHFASKEALLLALLDDMCRRFQDKIAKCLPQGEKDFANLSFPVVAEMMIQMALGLKTDTKGRAFFLLIHEQIRWSSSSMDIVRENLLKNTRWGPWEAFRTAVENDIRLKRARGDVLADEIASCCIALWNGLVHTHIANFLPCDLGATLTHAYAAIWRDIQLPKEKGE